MTQARWAIFIGGTLLLQGLVLFAARWWVRHMVPPRGTAAKRCATQARWAIVIGGTLLLYGLVFAVRWERTIGLEKPIRISDWLFISMFTTYCPVFLFVASRPRVGQERVCRRCDFLYDPEHHPDHCPRCHLDLTSPYAVVQGHLAMSRWEFGLGAGMLTFSAFLAALGTG